MIGLVLPLAGLLSCSALGERRPNVVLVVLDTVRADRLGCYGYDRPTTPHIDALCARGIRYANVSSTSSWTLPAHASLFTGLAPIRHGATQEHAVLETGASTLASLLAERGYATFGASANPVVSRRTGLARGFEHWHETWRAEAGGPAPRDHPNLVALRSFLRKNGTERPFFAFINYIEAHSPYLPPEPHLSRFLTGEQGAARVHAFGKLRTAELYLAPPSDARDLALLSDLYDGEIATVDALVGELIRELENDGVLDETLIVVTSDHGENLGDHGHFRHVFSLYTSTVRVPLVLRLPGDQRAGEVRREAASLLDLFSTILEYCGVSIPPGQGRGRDLLGALPADDVPVFAEYYYPLQVLSTFEEAEIEALHRVLRGFMRRLRSVEVDGRRLVWSSDGQHALFDLRSDPSEQHNLRGAPEVADVEAELEALLDAYAPKAGGGRSATPALGMDAQEPFRDVDPESRARLKELGYVR